MVLETILSAVAGPLIGGVSAIASSFFSNKHEENKLKADIKKTEVQTKLVEVAGKSEQGMKMLDILQRKQKGEFDDVANSRNANATTLSKLDGKSFILALNGLVRPVIAISVFGLYVIAKFVFIYHGYEINMSLAELAHIIFGDRDYHILSMVLAFYFTARQMNKINKI